MRLSCGHYSTKDQCEDHECWGAGLDLWKHVFTDERKQADSDEYRRSKKRSGLTGLRVRG